MEAEEFLFVMHGKIRLKLFARGLWKLDIKKVYPLITESLIGLKEVLNEERGDDEYAMAFNQLSKKKEIENRHIHGWMTRDTSKLKIQ